MRRFWRIAACLAAVTVAWCAAVGMMIWNYGAVDRAAPADCIIVLGAAVQGDGPSPVFAERISHGIDLQRRGLAPTILFTGGVGEGTAHSESGVGERMAIGAGVSESGVLKEERSHTTRQNLLEASEVMKEHGLRSAIVVSDPLHMKRAMTMAADLKMDAVSSPTPTSRYRSLGAKLPFLIREIYFYHHYLVLGQ